MQKKELGPVGKFLLSILITIGSCYVLFFHAFPDYQKANDSISWPKVSGRIVRSEVIIKKSSDRKDKTTHTYGNDILYQYYVNNRNYSSSKIKVGGLSTSSSDSTEAYRIKNSYPVGASVDVFYSPQDVSYAVLENGVHSGHYYFILLCASFAFLGFVIFFSSLLKVTLFSGVLVLFLKDFFEKKKSNLSSSPNRDLSDNFKNEHLTGHNINLDEEMRSINKISSSSIVPHEQPWNYKWIIKGKDKDFGPFEFNQVQTFYKQGKIKDNHNCYSSTGGLVVKISDIIRKKAS